MPDEKPKLVQVPRGLDKDRLHKIAARVQPLIEDARCTICGNDHFELTDGLGALGMLERTGVPAKVGSHIPLVILNCSKCGNTWLLNAFILRVLDPETGAWADD